MKITLSIDDQIVAKARRIAAVRGTSPSQLVRDYLKDLTRPRHPRDVLEQLDAMWWEGTGRSDGLRVREELYDRS